jgi:putative peptidoglycan lipid II flippase
MGDEPPTRSIQGSHGATEGAAPAETRLEALPGAGAQGLLRSAFLVGSITFLSRITGLFREIVHAWFLGTGMAADAFRVAFQLPNLFRRLVGEGAVSSAFVPVYAQSTIREGSGEGKVFAEKFLTLWIGLLALMTLLGIALSGWIIEGACAFREAAKLELTTQLSRILFGYLILIGGAAAAQGILNARGIFGAPSFAPVVFNVVFIAAASYLVPRLGAGREAFAMAFAVLLGGFFQLVLVLPSLWRLGIRFRPRSPFGHPGVRQVLRLLIPGTLGAGVYQINVVLSTALATRLETGAVAALGYSNRLMEFVLGIFVFAVSTVSLTALSRHAAEENQPAFQRTLSEVLRLVIFITVPSTVGLYVLRRPILSFLFETGQFDQRSLELTAQAFRYHVLGMALVGINRILVASFYARKDFRTPLFNGAVNVAANLLLAYTLSEGNLQHAGIALAASLAAGLQMVTLLFSLTRRLGGLRFPGLLSGAAKTLLASAVMGAASYFAMAQTWGPRLHGKLSQGMVIAALILLGAGVFFAVSWLLRSEELSVLFRGLTRKPGRREPP